MHASAVTVVMSLHAGCISNLEQNIQCYDASGLYKRFDARNPQNLTLNSYISTLILKNMQRVGVKTCSFHGS